jgi:hypothetical protein
MLNKYILHSHDISLGRATGWLATEILGWRFGIPSLILSGMVYLMM